ncbi:AAA family ATPase [Candidatus Methanoliparum sp. LAM-1]|nr:AAA family ATPase [Candidatus Methanoliparum sp. LAM-1]BDC36022.1 hypothetical protein MTLP_07040 [Candidatus Methanoliparum sp. LAM-1]
MIIKSIKIKDFISHVDTELNFNPYETAVIVGPNGAGKTSIIDAILYSLFGEKPRGDSVKDIIRIGKNSTEVDLIFQESGQEYRVIRTRDLKGNYARLLKGDNHLATDKEVTSEVRRITGLDKNIAISSIFIRQGEISKLLDDQPKERKNLIGRLVGLDKLERSWENIKSIISYFDDVSRRYDNFKVKLDDLTREIKSIEERIKERCDERERMKKDRSDKKNELVVIKNKYDSLKQDRDRYQELNASLKELNIRMDERDDQIEKLKKELSKAENAKKDVERLEKDIWKIEYVERYVKLIRDKERLEKDLKEIKSLKTEIDETKDAHDKFEILNKSKNELLSKKDRLNEDYKKITEIDTKIEYLNKELENKIKENINLESKAASILPIVTIERKKEKIKELREILDDIESSLNYIKTREGEIKGRLHEINEYLEILGDKEACPVCKRPFQTDKERDKVKNDLEIERDRLSIDIEDYKRKKDGLIIQRDDINRSLEEIKNIEIERIEEIKNEIKYLERDKDILKPVLIEIEKTNERLKEVDSEIECLKDFYDRYNAAKTSLRYRNIEDVKADIDLMIQNITDIEADISSTISIIGYEPKDGEEELKRLRKSKEEYDRLSSKVEDIPAIKEELQRYKDEKEDLIVKSKSIEDEIKKLAFSDEEFKRVEKTYNEISSEISELEGSIKQLEKQLDTYTKDLDEKNDQISKIEEKVKEADKIKSFCQDLEQIKNAFSRDGMQKVIRKRIAPLISEVALSYLDRFNLDIESIDINEDFDIELWKQSGKVPIASISGGEKVAVAIAIRLAIANVLSSKISTIIMDEPTTNLDGERINELAEILSNFSTSISSNVPVVQLIIVTHQEELENIADTIYRVEKKNGVSYVKEISQIED